MNAEEMKNCLKFGMKIALEMKSRATNDVVKLQFVSNGFTVVTVDEADVFVTDDKSKAEQHYSAEKVVVQLLDLPPAIREVAEIPESDRFALFDIQGNGFGAISAVIGFLRQSPHTVGDDAFETTKQ